MKHVIGKGMFAAALLALISMAAPASAQITTGTVAGTVKDSSGGVIPGASVVLISESRGTRSVTATTNATGDYVFPNITPDTYTVEVTMPGFRTLRRDKVAVSGGDRVVVQALTVEPGGASETVNVTADVPLIQAQSGERSFAITSTQIENLPLSGNRNFAALTALTPGTIGTNRIGGGGQNNIMMDGISAMDTGNNGQMLQMNVESIAEVKVLAQGYQAEFGRSSGLQITAVTKSGTNRFHGAVYDIEDNSKWNSNTWVREKNLQAKERTQTRTFGYTVGGPAGKPGGNNKLFFFYSHEYRPSKSGGAINQFRVPTELERRGDFSQTRDNNGALFNTIKDPLSASPCTAANTAGCFADGGVLGRIPQSRLYQVGLNLLNRYPTPTREQTVGSNYNYEEPRALDTNLLQQPALRVDYQVSPALRFTAKYSGQRQKRRVIPGTMSPFNDVLTPYPYITNYGVTVNYTINPTTFLEGTYGFIRNELAGGGSGGLLTDPSASLNHPLLAGLPILYPDAGKLEGTAANYYAYEIMEAENPVYWDSANKKILVPPNFQWGNRIGGQPPTQTFPGFLNINRTQDVAVSLTKVAGRHTMKAGFYNNHSFKAQNTGAGGVANLSPFGYIDFGNDTSNALDSGFGYANASLGVFRQYLQQAKFVEGSMQYDNTEVYVQDNWKVNNRITVDYGLRLTRQQPQHDQFKQMSNFFPNLWSAAAAPLLYVTGCSGGAVTCTGNNIQARHPVTGQLLTIPGVLTTNPAVGTVVPGSGDLVNGIRQAGDGIADTSYVWPTIVYAPRFGIAYDLTGTQSTVIRGGGGLFYDRPDGNTIFSIPTNPPMTTSQDLRNGQLQNLGTGLSPVGVPALSTFQYDAKVPSSVQWNAGIQAALPWASSVDISYVGQKGFNRINQVNMNQVNLGAAYLAQNQDLTRAATTVPGNNAYTANLLRPYRGLSNIQQQTTAFYDLYHSVQTSFNRRFTGGVSFGMNYTLSLVFEGNSGLTQRLQHAADGTPSVRADQAQYEELNKQLDLRRHILRANAVWDMPDFQADGGLKRALGVVLNDWQLTGILSAGSAGRYDVGYSYNANGTTTNLSGSPDYNPRIRIVGDTGSGCSDNQFAQFNVAAFSGPGYNSDALESGRNYMIGCPDKTVDLSLSRNIRMGGGRTATIRLDAFNAFNVVVINGRSTTVQYNSPTDLTLRNSQTLADGSLDPARLIPSNAGFGAATGAQAMRTMRLTFRFGF